MKNNIPNQDQLWMPCPLGMLSEVTLNLSKSRGGGQNKFDRRRMLQIAAAVAITGTAGTIADRSQFPQTQNRPELATGASDGLRVYGGISCQTFIENLEAYVEKGLKDHKLVASMGKHMEVCENCRNLYETSQNV